MIQTGTLALPVQPATGTTTRRRLTDEQRAIVEADDTHLMVEAGAGSGKTTVLVEKLLYEMGHGARPKKGAALDLSQIGAITFTRKAAGEIQERLRQELLRHALNSEGRDRERWAERAFLVGESLIGTIDGFASRIIRDFGALAGVEGSFETLDPADALALHTDVAEASLLAGVESGDAGAAFLVQQFGFQRARQITTDLLSRADVLDEVLTRTDRGEMDWSRFRFKMTAVDHLLEPRSHQVLTFAGTALNRLRGQMDQMGVLDHAHVILRAAELASHPAVRAAFQEKVGLLFVDEHQDTSLPQARLILRLIGLDDPGSVRSKDVVSQQGTPAVRLVLIGDPKQGIYGFRGADITMWSKSWQSLRVAGGRYMRLSANHRSRPTLLRFFDETLGPVLGHEAKGRFDVPYNGLTPARPDDGMGGVELLLASRTGAAESAELVAERIAQMLRNPHEYPVRVRESDGSETTRPLRARDVAILSRNLKGVADIYEQALSRRGVGAYVYGGRGLYAREEVQDVATLLKAVADPHDPFALISFLRSPMGTLDDHALVQLSAVSTAARRGEARGTLYDALRAADEILADDEQRLAARAAVDLLDRLRELRDRIPHDRLIETAVEESGYRAYLAGAPDSPAGIRNLDKLLKVARRGGSEPLLEFANQLYQRVRRADPEEEAPLYTPDDDLVTISTIHKAKGLEWPYVVLVGIEDGMFRRVPDREPILHADIGLALPLEVVVRDGARTEAAPETSRAWQQGWTDQTHKDHAEARRLFYVACTRARDGLILAGALKSTKRESSLHSRPEWLHKDGVERWLRHIFRELAQGKDRLRYGRRLEAGNEITDWVTVVRGMDGVQALHPGGAEADHLPTVRPWPATPVPDGEAEVQWPASAEARIESVSERSAIRTEFTASELLKFASCPWLHAYSYRGSVSSPTLEIVSGDAIVNRILPEVRGDILHDFLQEHQVAWTAEEKAEQMKRALLRHIPMPEDEAEENVHELLLHAENYLGSEVHQREKAAATLHRELPYVVRLPSGMRVHGIIDRLFDDAGGWHIVDFKSGLFRGVEHRIRSEVAKRAEEYEIQAAIYALGVASAAPDMPVRRFTFYFTHPAIPHTIEVTPEWLAEWERKIGEIIDRIRRGDYGPEPVYEPSKCDNCPMLRLCRPKGAPEDLLNGTTVRTRF